MSIRQQHGNEKGKNKSSLISAGNDQSALGLQREYHISTVTKAYIKRNPLSYRLTPLSKFGSFEDNLDRPGLSPRETSLFDSEPFDDIIFETTVDGPQLESVNVVTDLELDGNIYSFKVSLSNKKDTLQQEHQQLTDNYSSKSSKEKKKKILIDGLSASSRKTKPAFSVNNRHSFPRNLPSGIGCVRHKSKLSFRADTKSSLLKQKVPRNSGNRCHSEPIKARGNKTVSPIVYEVYKNNRIILPKLNLDMDLDSTIDQSPIDQKLLKKRQNADQKKITKSKQNKTRSKTPNSLSFDRKLSPTLSLTSPTPSQPVSRRSSEDTFASSEISSLSMISQPLRTSSVLSSKHETKVTAVNIGDGVQFPVDYCSKSVHQYPIKEYKNTSQSPRKTPTQSFQVEPPKSPRPADKNSTARPRKVKQNYVIELEQQSTIRYTEEIPPVNTCTRQVKKKKRGVRKSHYSQCYNSGSSDEQDIAQVCNLPDPFSPGRTSSQIAQKSSNTSRDSSLLNSDSRAHGKDFDDVDSDHFTEDSLHYQGEKDDKMRKIHSPEILKIADCNQYSVEDNYAFNEEHSIPSRDTTLDYPTPPPVPRQSLASLHYRQSIPYSPNEEELLQEEDSFLPSPIMNSSPSVSQASRNLKRRHTTGCQMSPVLQNDNLAEPPPGARDRSGSIAPTPGSLTEYSNNDEEDDICSLPSTPPPLIKRKQSMPVLRRRSSSLESLLSRPGSDFLEVPLHIYTPRVYRPPTGEEGSLAGSLCGSLAGSLMNSPVQSVNNSRATSPSQEVSGPSSPQSATTSTLSPAPYLPVSNIATEATPCNSPIRDVTTPGSPRSPRTLSPLTVFPINHMPPMSAARGSPIIPPIVSMSPEVYSPPRVSVNKEPPSLGHSVLPNIGVAVVEDLSGTQCMENSLLGGGGGGGANFLGANLDPNAGPMVSLTTDDGDDFNMSFGRRGSVYIEKDNEQEKQNQHTLSENFDHLLSIAASAGYADEECSQDCNEQEAGENVVVIQAGPQSESYGDIVVNCPGSNNQDNETAVH